MFIACRVLRTFRKICNLTYVPKKTLGLCYKALERAFALLRERMIRTQLPARC